METIVCGAWHNAILAIDSLDRPDVRRRIFACSPDSQKPAEYFAVGVDLQQVFNGKSAVEKYAFLHTISKKTKIITLTKKEKHLLLTSGMVHPVRLFCFEEMYPFYAEIKFVNQAEKNYQRLRQLLADVSTLNIRGGTTDYYSKKFLYKIARKVKHRASLDAFFAHASLSPYQETFKLADARPNRKIIALDFNSMYGDCLRGQFADPATLSSHTLNSQYDDSKKLPRGLYRVRLSQPTSDFISQYHALKFVFLNKKYTFSFAASSSIETLLHSNEIEYYARHFSEIHLLEAVLSHQSIPHPLTRDAERIYAQRQHYKKQQNKKLERLCKLQIATMHSAVKHKQYQVAQFNDYSSALQFLRETFGLSMPPEMSPLAFLSTLSDGVKFIIKIESAITIKYLTHHSDSLLFSLFSQVIANARVKMMQTIEFLLKFPELELCYCNIDSVHLSLPDTRVTEFYQYLAPLMGDEMGQLKLENEADQGYWFESGRYWLIKNNSVIQFKNQGLHNPYARGQFQDSRAWYKIYQEAGYSIPIKCRRQLATTLTYKKYVGDTSNSLNIAFERYTSQQLSSGKLIQESLLNEIKASAALKLDLFNQLAATFEAQNATPSRS